MSLVEHIQDEIDELSDDEFKIILIHVVESAKRRYKIDEVQIFG